MRKYERRKRRLAALKTLFGCIGWGCLGYFLMNTGWFWLGWALLTSAVCVGAYALDRLLSPGWRAV